MEKTDTAPNPDVTIETDYQYDGTYSGKLKSTVTDGLGRVKEYLYNSTGTLASETDKGDPNAGTQMVVSYTYDDNGNVLTKTAPDSTVTTYTYDSMNRLIKTLYAADYYIDYTYDGNGIQNTMTKTKGTETEVSEWEYDAKDRVERIKLNGDTVAEYEYTDNDSVSEMRYPNGQSWRKFSYTYDSDGNMDEIKDVTDAQNSKLIRKYIYNSEGVLTDLKDYRKFAETVNDGDYTLQHFDYDTDNSLKTVTYSDVDMDNGQIISTTQKEKYDLTLDGNGNILTEDIDYDYGTHADLLKQYEYDAFGRLLKEKVNNATTAEYTYDNAGNRTSMAANSSTLYYQYNEFNQLEKTATDSQFNNVVTTFGYDGRGNQITQTEGTTVTTYDYDLADLLLDVKKQVGQDPQTTLASYWYDGAGQRIKKTESSNTFRYYYDNLTLLYTDDGTSQRLEENILEPNGSLIASKRFTGDYAGKTYFYRQDIRGSVSNIVDKDGARVMGYNYDAYGNTTEVGDTDFINSKAYTAAVNDETVGLIYMNARYYNPATGRFLTQDSYRGSSNEPWPWQLYGYCDGDPVNNTDPNGNYYNALDMSYSKYSKNRINYESTKITLYINMIFDQNSANNYTKEQKNYVIESLKKGINLWKGTSRYSNWETSISFGINIYTKKLNSNNATGINYGLPSDRNTINILFSSTMSKNLGAWVDLPPIFAYKKC